MTRRVASLIVAVSTPLFATAAQTGYYNLDAGRPNRVEDAAPTPLYELEVQFASARAERLVGGTYRYRTEPKLSYGIVPYTELEVRVPVLRVVPTRETGASTITGVASVGVGAMRAVTLESSLMPAISLGGELLLPYGQLAPPSHAYFLKILGTKTTPWARFNVNAGTGTYSVQAVVPSAAPDTQCIPPRLQLPGGTNPCGSAPPLIFDFPCSRAPAATGGPMALTQCSAVPADTMSAAATPRTRGTHWMAGIGADHVFALHSTLVSADVVAERYVGLYDRVDYTGEIGLRRQITPHFVFDAGVSRHFAGAIQSTSLAAGVTMELPTHPPWAR